MESWLQEIFNSIPGGGIFLAAVFIIAYLEALVAVGLIMPGSFLTVFSGFLAFHGKADIGWVMLAAAAGAFAGDLCSYWFGGRFGEYFWHRNLLKKHRDLLRKTELFFLEHGGKSVFFGRFLGPIRGLVPFVAGASRMSPLAFFSYTLFSGLLWGISYPGLGYLGGTSWQRAETLAGRLGLLVLLALISALAVAWLRHKFLPKRE
jgi:undecaprenyl-diphosphatase